MTTWDEHRRWLEGLAEQLHARAGRAHWKGVSTTLCAEAAAIRAALERIEELESHVTRLYEAIMHCKPPTRTAGRSFTSPDVEGFSRCGTSSGSPVPAPSTSSTDDEPNELRGSHPSSEPAEDRPDSGVGRPRASSDSGSSSEGLG